MLDVLELFQLVFHCYIVYGMRYLAIVANRKSVVCTSHGLQR